MSRTRAFAVRSLAAWSVLQLLLGIVVADSLRCDDTTALSWSEFGATVPVYGFEPGRRLVYRVEYSSTSASDLTGLFADAQPADRSPILLGLAHTFQTAVRGELTVIVAERRADRVIVAYRLREPVVGIIANGQDAIPEGGQVGADLTREIFAELDARGRILVVHIDPATRSLSQGFARALLAATQIVLPGAEASPSRQWEAEEEDTNGVSAARYQARPGGADGMVRIVKTRTRYLPQRSAAASEGEPVVEVAPRGQAVACLTKAGRLALLEGAEGQTLTLADKVIGSVETSFRMKYLAESPVPAAQLSALRAEFAAREKQTPGGTLSAGGTSAQHEELIQKNELGEATLESLLEDLARAESSRGEAPAETALYLKFKALVSLHPETSIPLGRTLITAGAESVALRVLTAALAEVGHTEAQAALVTAVRARSNDWAALATLLPSLSTSRTPAPAAEEALGELAWGGREWNVASTAQLALGTMARKLAKVSPERASRIVARMVKELEGASSPQGKRQMLLALGNTAAGEAVPAIERYINAPSPELRGAALIALRWMAGAEIEELLNRAAASDPDEGVRAEAAAARRLRK